MTNEDAASDRALETSKGVSLWYTCVVVQFTSAPSVIG